MNVVKMNGVSMRCRVIVVACCAVPLVCGWAIIPLSAQTSLPDHPQPQQSLPDAPSFSRSVPEHPNSQMPSGATGTAKRVDEAWPRKATRGDETISMYQPQVETWKGDEVRAYAALSVMSTTNKTTKYGVLWFI